MERRTFLSLSACATVAALLPATAEASGPMRTVEVFKDSRFQAIPWRELKKGMVFRLREPTGEIEDEGTDHECALATEDVSEEEAPVFWGVKAQPFTKVSADHDLPVRILLSRHGKPLGFVVEFDMTVNGAWQRRPDGDIRYARFDTVEVEFLGSPTGV